ncbi:MAG: hypothetical protein ATN34_02940 [Epulopiscium sp. Nele67-Bin002]|nr:MAG: hypothetical protein BEN18_09195 [Epulopiscium sp. Nuni2H_MBin001]OON91776.1 MAG: hypothetical protein ATN33_08595 [Epulopiscium sp. Nele67-Bin001]OON91998.1 MAG: hypothetical protein ATN34_02940 [Epulopiscium sp. Nele67-Bin002]
MKYIAIDKIDFLLICLGVGLLAIGVQWFFVPIGLVTGGISGFGIVVYEVTSKHFAIPIPIALTNILVNIPLFAISIKQRGFNFAKKSLYAVILFSVWLSVLEYFPNPFRYITDILLIGIFGGATIGIGIGIVLRTGSTTGGTDMLASIIKFIAPKFPIPKLMLAIDAIIIIAGMSIFGLETGLYAIISVLVTTKMISIVLEGGLSVRAAFIITSKSSELIKKISEQLPEATMQFQGRKMVYSGQETELLFAVLAEKQLPKLKSLIMNIDPNAFVTIGEVREVLGQEMHHGL